MDFQKYFPIWDKLTKDQQERLQNAVTPYEGKKGTVLHNGDIDCIGLLLIKSGQLRVFVLSDEGREITLYRLFDMDICLFSSFVYFSKSSLFKSIAAIVLIPFFFIIFK